MNYCREDDTRFIHVEINLLLASEKDERGSSLFGSLHPAERVTEGATGGRETAPTGSSLSGGGGGEQVLSPWCRRSRGRQGNVYPAESEWNEQQRGSAR